MYVRYNEYLGFRTGAVVTSVVPGYGASSLDDWCRMFQSSVVVSFLKTRHKTIILCRSIGYQSSSDETSHPIRTETSFGASAVHVRVLIYKLPQAQYVKRFIDFQRN